MSEQEEVLTGGNVNQVVRIGATVRRSARPDPYVQELLVHLEKVGYDHAPRYLGVDEEGREILSYLDGHVPGNDYPDLEEYMWSDESLIEVAKLLRSYHDATIGFTTTSESTNRYPDITEDEVVCHNDFAPYNMVYKAGHPQGIIDFDMAGPGPRMWDIAYTLYTSVPLANFSPELNGKGVITYASELHGAIRKNRIALFMTNYGLGVPADLKEWIVARIRFMCQTLSDRAAAGERAFINMVEEGHLAHYERELIFLEKHFDDWT
ncbi:aminoglycoside phosphotransferase family protein [Paenibacillus amylolyticus]|nr:aminoglycoside phosphotransferase family protein [Paenibacillus amylolyticus]WFR61674.1 aminoglycoside phosphotransferase family protein [Paenibacillus amylolyticus]